ncbi:type VII secretion protein EccB [Nocardia mangyaensis]|uniref:type VII secretion protein EccB n=1 Tax=Nocardia mangyaensis TaxID=2213200 RepID=UPI0026768B29|nr:type VII secretion protein EccB [Nocardia mangyaensis]MDO3648210.1 type VII secretion protein EccB [Nocardia mangyaensis]
MARFRVVSKHQVSGWRFLLRRIEHALVRRDASMLDDPQRGRSTALMIGFALACVGVAGAAVLAFFSPAKNVGDSPIVADKDSGALFVHMGGRMYPALNLTSARLITGQAADPVRVGSAELAKYPRGPWVGIPGAPGHMVGTSDRDSFWAVCDRARGGAAATVDPQAGVPMASTAPVHTTAIGGRLTVDGSAARELGADEARLMRNGRTIWLVYRDGENGAVRAMIDLADSAVTLALGLDATAPVMPASAGLIEAIPEVPALRVPEVPEFGTPTTFSTGLTVPVGSVLTVAQPDRGAQYYLVSQSGAVRVSPVLAAMVRNADVQGSISSQTVSPSVIAANLRPGNWPGTAHYPDRPVRLVDTSTHAVTCLSWERLDTEPRAIVGLLVGRQLPLAADEQRLPVTLVTAAGSAGRTADAAYLPRTTGRFIQVTGDDPGSGLRESLWWVSDSGVRYGLALEAGRDPSADPTLRSLNLGSPVPAPWSIVSLFAVGPTLSQVDARIQHDGISANDTGAGFGGDGR